MAKLTVQAGFFGAIGVDDPVCFMNQRTIGRSVDFSKVNVDENKNYPLIPIPKGFCLTHIAVEQVAPTDQDATVTFGAESDSGITVGGNFALKDLSSDAEALLRSCQPAKTVSAKDSAGTGTVAVPDAIFFDKADMLCLKVPNGLTGDKLAKGKINVYLIGFETFAEGTDSVPENMEDWRKKLQTADNVSGGQVDPREFEG